MTRDEFLDEIEAFLKDRHMTGADFGKLMMNDRGFVSRLRKGKDVRTETIKRVLSRMRNRVAAE